MICDVSGWSKKGRGLENGGILVEERSDGRDRVGEERSSRGGGCNALKFR